MRYINTVIILLFIALFGSLAGDSHAFIKESDPSARVVPTIQVKKEDIRVTKLKAYLIHHNSPMADHADDFIAYADKYNLDWKFVVSIAGVESGYGKRYPIGTYNGWGWGYNNGTVRQFASWEDAIETISKGLREDYMNKRGAENIHQIGSIYAASQTWSQKVTYFMNKLEAFDPESVKSTPELSVVF